MDLREIRKDVEYAKVIKDTPWSNMRTTWGEFMYGVEEDRVKIPSVQETISKDKVSTLLWEDLPDKEKTKLTALSNCVNEMFNRNPWFSVEPLFKIDKAGFKVDFDTPGYKTLRKFHCVDLDDITDSDKQMLAACIKQCLGMI